MPTEELPTAPADAALIPEDAATQHINLAGDTVTKATAGYADEERALVRWAFDYAKSQGWGWKEATRFFKVSNTTLYRVWTDKYRYPDWTGGGKNKPKEPHPRAGERFGLESVVESLTRAKKMAEARAGVSKLPFIETTVYQRVAKVCEETLISQSIGFIFGESQIGKTKSLEEYARRNNHGQTILVTMPPSAGVQLMCKQIAAALHVGGTCFDNTFQRIIKALDGEKLLIIDEAHMIFETYQRSSVKRCLATLRHIHDASKCGLVISATDVFETEARNAEFRNTMKQVFRRGTLTLQLGTQPPWEDVAMVVDHYELPVPPDALSFTEGSGKAQKVWRVHPRIALLAREDGLGKITKYLAGAARMAAKKSEPMSWHYFERYVAITDRMAQPVEGGK